MTTYNYKYHRYRLTYPYIGNIIYRSKSINKVAKKCYNNLKNIKNIKYIQEGLFIITDLNDNTEYKYQIKNKININMNK
uniref:Uncharacterized protein n=1 Tax=Mimivirus LCMiAC02 TaxID=2506609 RepID=A0A481Z186_9VIRU|nr:MAG: hypothetical protein LCMiAC02_00140 [Mimivirus LCMiAC02]